MAPASQTGINDLFARDRDGANLLPGELLTFEVWPHRIVVEQVPNPGEIALGEVQPRPGAFSA